MTSFRLSCLVLLCVVMGWSSAALAQRGNHIQGVRPEVHLTLGWHASFGVGGRIEIPLISDGFIDTVDDEFAIAPGADLYFVHFHDHDHADDDNLAVAVPVVVQWNFYVGEWSLFPELGLGLWFGGHGWNHHHHRDHDHHDDVDFTGFFGLGARYHFGARNALLLRLTWPGGFQIGLTF